MHLYILKPERMAKQRRQMALFVGDRRTCTGRVFTENSEIWARARRVGVQMPLRTTAGLGNINVSDARCGKYDEQQQSALP